MDRRILLTISIPLVGTLIAIAIFLLLSGKMRKERGFYDRPLFLKGFSPRPQDNDMRPYSLFFHQGLLYVGYKGSGKIDVFTPDMNIQRSIQIEGGISSFAVDDDRIYLADHPAGSLRIVDREGRALQSFSSLPDKKTPLRPFAISLYKGNLYASDLRMGAVLVISMRDELPLTRTGELILTISGTLSPSGLAVTPDGRLLVSDLKDGEVRAYTCNGKYISTFEDTKERNVPKAPSGIAFDNVASPELLALNKTSFDPSGVREQGRIHIADSGQNRVFVFNSIGKYVLSYGEGILSSPHGIAIDRGRRLIFIADTGHKRIAVFRY